MNDGPYSRYERPVRRTMSGLRTYDRFAIFEMDDDGSGEWFQTGSAANIETASRFTKKIKNVIVRDNQTDSFVIVKKEN